MALPPGADPDLQHEELETIPWAMLADHLETRRWNGYVKYLLAACAFVVAFLVALNVSRRPQGTVVELSPQPVAVAGELAVPATSTTDAQAAVPSSIAAGTPPAPALYSEADLMAVLPETFDANTAARFHAAMAAEWYVADYFTSDSTSPPASWVEWAIPAKVDQSDQDLYAVVVGYQTLLTDVDGVVRRSPPQAVAVTVRSDGDMAEIIGLPEPAEFEALVEVADGEPGRGDVPSEIAQRATVLASGLGDDPQIEGGVEVSGGGWRVVVNVADEVGLRWRFSIVVPPSQAMNRDSE